MSSNVSALDQAQAVDPAPAPGFPLPSSDLSVSLSNAPTIVGPIPVPAPVPAPVSAPTQPPAYAKPPSKEMITYVANLIAEYRVFDGARYAAGYHKYLNQADPPTADELMTRYLDTLIKLGKPKFREHHQGSPNSTAQRFLADRAGPGCVFEEDETNRSSTGTDTDKKGKPITGRKCGLCSYRGIDRTRHNTEIHIKDPVLALFCPYHGCDQVFFGGSSRCSQMKSHMKGHEEDNNAQKKSRRGIMPLSTYRLYHLQ